MLETAEVGHVVSKRAYDRAEPALREALLNAQYDLFEGRHKAVVVLLSGVAAGGRGETAMKLAEWMDPRHLRVLAFGPRTPEELAHPPAWRYWQALPPRGRISVFMNAWYAEAMQARVSGRMDDAALDAQLHAIRDYERMMPQEDVLLVKFWIHLSKSAQKARLAEARPEEVDDLARHRRRLEPRPAVREVAQRVGAHAARNVDRRSPVVRRRGHRCALPRPHRRPHPARIADAGQRRGGRARPGPGRRGRRPPRRRSSTTSS